MTLTEAKRIAKNAESATTEELAKALDVILNDDRLTETQCNNLMHKIDSVLTKRIAR